MNTENWPSDEIRNVLSAEMDPHQAMRSILDHGRKQFDSSIWNAFEGMNIERDIQEAHIWLNTNLKQYPDYTGIYLGLDTLNMDEGNGYNLDIGLSNRCNPQLFDDEWCWECEYYGESHLIKGLFEVSDCFNNEEKWTAEACDFAEYTIFLGYSGLVLRETLKCLKTSNNYLSMWGFHDGDMFFLCQKIGACCTIVTEVEG